MELPRTIATVISREQAIEVENHLHGALRAGAGTLLLYTSLDGVGENPSSLKDFPAPDLYVNETVYVIGISQTPDDFLAQVSEHSEFIDHNGGGE